MGTMKRLITYFLLLVGFAYACAQDFGARTYPTQQDFQSHQIMSSGANYGGTVYKPFDNTTPSEQSEVGASYSPNRGPRRAGENNDDYTPGWEGQTGGPDGNQGEGSPVGEPWVLLAFAAVFAGAIAFRRKKQTV